MTRTLALQGTDDLIRNTLRNTLTRTLGDTERGPPTRGPPYPRSLTDLYASWSDNLIRNTGGGKLVYSLPACSISSRRIVLGDTAYRGP